MRDKISEDRVLKLHPRIRTEVKELIEKAETQFPPKIAIRIVQGYRTIQEQNDLYAIGRTKPGKKVTNAKGGSSFHNYGLAIDFALMYDKDGNGTWETLSWDTRADFDNDKSIDWLEVVKIFEAAGYQWGGKFSTITDMPHLQKTFGFKWQELLARHEVGQEKDGYIIV